MGFAKVLEDEIDSFFSGFNCTSEMKLNVFLSSKRSNWMTPELETRRITSAAQLIMHRIRGQMSIWAMQCPTWKMLSKLFYRAHLRISQYWDWTLLLVLVIVQWSCFPWSLAYANTVTEKKNGELIFKIKNYKGAIIFDFSRWNKVFSLTFANAVQE